MGALVTDPPPDPLGEGETVDVVGGPDDEQLERTVVDDDRPKYRQKAWLYQQYHLFGRSMSDMAEIADVSETAIFKNMKKHDIPRRDAAYAASKAMGTDDRLWDEEWLREQYVDKGKLASEIADMLDVHPTTVGRFLDKMDIGKRSDSETNRLAQEEKFSHREYYNENWLRHQYQTLGKSTLEIANEYGWSKNAVNRALERHGIQIRSNTAANLNRYKKKNAIQDDTGRELVTSEGIDASWRDLKDVERGNYVPYRDRRWLKKRLDHGLSNQDIAELCGVSTSTIHEWRERHGLTESDNQ